MRILFLIDCIGSSGKAGSYGGKERQFVELLKALLGQKGVNFQVAVLSDQVYYPLIKDLKIKIYYLKRDFKKDLKIFLKLFKICKSFQPDIIYSWERMCSIYALPVAKLLGIKLINGSIRNAPPKSKFSNPKRIRDKLTFPFSDVVLANSYAGLESFNVPKNKGYCIHNGFNFSRITILQDPYSIRERFKINTSNVVGMVGNFNIRKDYTTYLLSAMRILQKRKDVTFLAIGDGSNARGNMDKSTFEISKKMVGPTFEGRIKFLGRQKNVESIINIFDIGILLTNQEVHGEGISNSIMEYMALGKPVIATHGGGTCEIVVENKTGFLVEPQNVDAVINKIEFLLNKKKVAYDMGLSGKERMQEEFSIDKMTARHLALYQKCIQPETG